jgi:hypothetical protein
MQVSRPRPLSLCESRGTLTDIVASQPAMREIFVLSVSGCVSDRVSQRVRGHEVADRRLNHTRGGEAGMYHRKDPDKPSAGQRDRRRPASRRPAGPPRTPGPAGKPRPPRDPWPHGPLGPPTVHRALSVPLNTMVSLITFVSPKIEVRRPCTASPATTVLVSFTAPAMRHM